MTPETLYDAAEATWPPAETQPLGPWVIRDGKGGGKRVSAATADGPVTGADIGAVEAAMLALGQDPLVMIRAGQDTLDAQLAARGYDIIDPVVAYAAPVAELACDVPPPVTSFHVWPPLKIQEELWAEGGIGPDRLAVMQRVQGPKTAVLGRAKDRAAGTAFAAIFGKIAFVHAVEVNSSLRRQKTAYYMMREAAIWAQDHGADSLVVLVTVANTGARALYASLGMQVVGQYHYRIRKGPSGHQEQ